MLTSICFAVHQSSRSAREKLLQSTHVVSSIPPVASALYDPVSERQPARIVMLCVSSLGEEVADCRAAGSLQVAMSEHAGHPLPAAATPPSYMLVRCQGAAMQVESRQLHIQALLLHSAFDHEPKQRGRVFGACAVFPGLQFLQHVRTAAW